MRKLHKNSGFTLIEIMIAIAIIAIGIFGVMSLVITVMKGNTLSKRVTTATTIAQEELENFKRMDYDNAVDASGTDTAHNIVYYWEADVQDDTPATDTKTITIDVYWSSGGTDTTHNNVEMKTIIAK
ncbi:MAG: prepilin-type N-terminal cleavage/methylation domain-containing protein [Planctomycetota bacterium]|jgi:prepilin-type N-terminal cleavage/methylation domain-containing protein